MESVDEKKIIVVVEDDPKVAELIKDVLEIEPDYDPVAVRDGRQALEVIHSVAASLILLDVRLPGLDGLQLYDMLRADDATREIPVIFVTANSDSAAFKSHHIEHFVAKPFAPDELLDQVAAALQS
jgi:CheY-like chemotaxis protein